MQSAVAEPQAYDWQGEAPLQRAFAHTVMDEMHVAGCTQHPSSGVAPAQRGTSAGLIEKIPSLVDLGVTAAELLPVLQVDAQDTPPGRVNS
jgi:glycogen operon protein